MEEGRLSRIQRENIYNLCIGSLNRICITDDKEEIIRKINVVDGAIYFQE